MNTKIETLLEKPIIEVDLHEAVYALAEALSLVGIDEHQHGERVAYMASSCAHELNWEQAMVDNVFYAALLHDCGVSSSVVHKKLIAEMDWDGAELHCVLGDYYLKNFPPLSHLAPIVRYHHTHWDQIQETGLPENITLASNLIYMVDRVDAISAQLKHEGKLSSMEQIEHIRQKISYAAGEHFAPELVEAFLEVSSNDAFWLTLEPLNLAEYISTQENRSQPLLTQYDDVRKLARIFAHIVDAKSSFTYDHSMGVSQVSRRIATLLDLPKQRVALIELAGLLHDLGKLGVPDEILEKKGPLNADEATIMHRHSYETFRILSRIKGFENIAEWAGNHHETLLGDGYPFQHEETELSVEARIIAIADIFQALAQDRPYRKALPPEAILTELQNLADAGKIDKEIVRVTGDHIDLIWEAATNKGNDWLPSLLN